MAERKSPNRMTTGILTVLILTTITHASPSHGQIGAKEVWNAGAVTINVNRSPGGGARGQGYLVARDNSLWLYTIGHVIQGASEVRVHIPGIYPDYVAWEQAIDLDRFECEDERWGDSDPSCYFKIKDQLAGDILRGVYPILPFVRNVTMNIVGNFVGTPRPDLPGEWTIYRVSSITDSQITIDSVPLDYNNDGWADTTLGSLCHGNSGSPLVLTFSSCFKQLGLPDLRWGVRSRLLRV